MSQGLLMILVVALLGWAVFRFSPTKKATVAPSADESRYKAVSIHSYRERCSAAREIEGKRYLASEAPLLPLAGCSAETCHCVYMHHSDRRSGTDRRLDHQTAKSLYGKGSDKRTSIGRRAGDLAPA